MEGKREETSPNIEQRRENIASESSDGQETSGRQSSSTTAPSSTPECPEKLAKSNERALVENTGVICPECNVELDPEMHLFCYRCGKTKQEIVSIIQKNQDTNRVLICSNCKSELDINIHRFCYRCGRNVQEVGVYMDRKEDPNHSVIRESDSSKPVLNTETDVRSNISVMKQHVAVEEEKTSAVEPVVPESQKVTTMSEMVTVEKTVVEAKSPEGNENELGAYIAKPIGSDETNKVIIVESEINGQETVVAKTMTECTQASWLSQEKTIDKDHCSLVKNDGGVEIDRTDINDSVQEANEDVIPSTPESDRSKQITSSETDVSSNMEKVKEVAVEEEKMSGVETIDQKSVKNTTMSEKVAVEKSKTFVEPKSREGNTNELGTHYATSTASDSSEQTSEKVIIVASEIEGQGKVVPTAMKENVQTSSSSQKRTIADDQTECTFVKNNDGGETGGTDIDDLVQKAYEDMMLGNGPESDDSSEQISRSKTDVTNNTMGIEQQVAAVEKNPAVAEKVDIESQQLAGVSEQTFVNKRKTNAAGSSQGESGNEQGVANSGQTLSGSNEQTSTLVITVANEIESESQVSGAIALETTREKQQQQQPQASIEKKTVNERNCVGKGNEAGDLYREVASESAQSNLVHEDGTDVELIDDTQERSNDLGDTILDLPQIRAVLDEFYEILEELETLGKEEVEEESKERKESNAKNETSGEEVTNETSNTNDEKTHQETPTPGQSDPQQQRAENKGTLLELVGQSSTGSSGPKVEGNDAPGHFYMKPELKEPEKKKKKKEKTRGNAHPRDDNTETVTVVFHALLSDKFKWDENKRIVIRGEEPVFYGWNADMVYMNTEKDIHKHLLVQGEIKIPKRLAPLTCGYKYVVVNSKKKNDAYFEEIVEYQRIWRGHMNRCLVIERGFVTENKIIHKYDGFIYPKPGKISLDRFFPFGSAIEDRKVFFQKFFPKWSGFHVDPFDSKIEVAEALYCLDCLVDGITALKTSTSGSVERHAVDSTKLGLGKLFRTTLKPKIENNLKVLEIGNMDVKVKVDALVSSLIIVYVFVKYNVYLEFDEIEILLKCIRIPPHKETCSEFMKSVNMFDEKTLSSLIETILKFYRRQASKHDLIVNWLPALPLLHFLRRESEPFQPVDCEKVIDATKLKWWGLQELPYRDIRERLSESEAIEMLPGLKDIFEMDRLLKRTFLLLCPVEMFGDLLKNGCFSCLELCVTMRKLLPDTKEGSSYKEESFVKNLALFFKEINQTLLETSPKEFPKERQPETLVFLANIVRLVKNVKQNFTLNHVEILCRLVECLITAIDVQKKGIDLQSESETDPDDNRSLSYQLVDIPNMSDFYKELFKEVEYFTDQKTYTSLEYKDASDWKQELQAWNNLLSLSAPKVFYETWHKKFMDKFQNRICKVSAYRQIELFCQSEGQECNPDIATCLSDAAFQAVEKIVRDDHGQQTTFNYLSQNRSSINCIKLLSTMLHKAWPPELNEDSESSDKDKILLNHLLTWSTWPGFLKFFGSNSASKEVFTKEGDWKIIIAIAESCLDNLINSVENGTVTVDMMNLLMKHSTQFLKLGEVHQTNQQAPISINESFSLRRSELKAFLALREDMVCFINLSTIFTLVDKQLCVFRDKIDQDYLELPIRDLCVKRSGKYFNLGDKFYDMVSKIIEIKSSRIFNVLWKKYGEHFNNKLVTMELILYEVWIKICEELQSINQEFLDGNMKLKIIDEYLNIFEMDYEALEKEFVLLSKYFNGATRLDQAEEKIALRITKVKRYQKLYDARQAAQAILDLQKALGLKGDFSKIESIDKIGGSFRNQSINAVSDGLLRAGDLLQGITPEKRSCLTTFIKCFELVTWLRESIKDEQELKVFVDLAMISAGEEDMEIDRISCMHTSCLGFGSLIFGYRQEHGFNDLMRICKPVWQAFDANPSIERKLILTKKGLSWLQQIKESHGSVALTTMVQVKAINSSGIYYIADRENTKYNKQKNNGVKSSLENLVCLVVPEDNDKNREEKIYSLEEVKDVQSKLMLIAGKAESGKEEVDQFNQVFEGILRVSDLYLHLCEVGEINYLTWKRKFQCSKIEGQRDEILREIDETCETMEKELKQWKETISNKRRQCYSLNHFTMKQILKLRKELAKACTGQVAVDKLPLQTFMLLETVNKNIDLMLLADVLGTMIPDNSIFFTEEGLKDQKKYFANDEEIDSILDENVEEEMDVIQPGPRRRANSIDTFTSAKETLESMSLDINTDDYLLAALQECGRRATKDELVFWVVSHENDDEETIMTSREEAKKNPRLSDLLKEVFAREDLTENNEEEFSDTSAHEREIRLPKVVPKSEKPYVNNEEDTYLTLNVLADVLEELSESESDYIQRKLPSVLKEGEPNLLLVPEGEVFGCVLSLFMGTRNEPLPTDEEVIVCDENTTAEEVELLWRRAVVDDRSLLFCLVNADLLDYDVSQQAVRSLELLTQGYSKYHLVVICSIENEDKSNMVASLDQFRRPFSPITSMRGIQKHLRRQLLVSYVTRVGDTKWEPAATVDMEKLSVRVVQSSRAGMGKSLILKHLADQVTYLPNNRKLREGLVPSLSPTIPVHGIAVDSDCVTRTLLYHAVKRDVPVSRIFHLDMSQSVVKGLDNFLFKLVILRSVKDHSGNVWRRKPTDMYVIEITTDKSFETVTADEASSEVNYSQNTRKRRATNKYSFIKFLPRTHCLTPRETLENIQQNKRGDTGFDMEKFHSEEYQRTFQYLTQFDAGTNLDQFLFIYDPQVTIGDPDEALKIIIQYCGIRDPSWAELYHFVNFLNVQLRDCEESVFCDPLLVGDLLQGFRTFAVRFMIQMSRDFATRSLSDNNLGVEEASPPEDDDLAPFQIRRRWELSPHPYIFFNHDRDSMTFLGFLLNENGDLLNPGTNQVLEPEMMDPTLKGQLKVQGVDFDVNYEIRDRVARIENLCSVMGIDYLYDPDPTYELTTDNVEKILAIHMRFRCGIPVIIMGETGCGKTRLIRFMCELQAGPDGPKNLLLMKVHGGTSYAEIEKKVEDAEKLALCNEKINVDTILFFDEANTTDAIDLIKEIMVDRRVNGRAINPELMRLHFIAACNPYRKHTKDMIQKLESAGLGYHVSADETEDKLGSIPLRQLVYRVHPLPESMRPLVWDFGQLTDHTEELYTAQIVRRFMEPPTQDPASVILTTGPFRGTLNSAAQATCIAKVLSASQKYMRKQKNECSFVSLRDVERAMKVIMWFYSNTELIDQAIEEEDNVRDEDSDSYEESIEDESDEDEIVEDESGEYVSDEDESDEDDEQPISEIVRAVILGIGVCYYARLNERKAYCRYICTQFDMSCPLPGGVHRMQSEIKRCQRGFLKDIQLGENIARNTALCENVFMMAICTELRIPLFVVGKPGSSKSLAKDVISTNMKAANSQSELFKNLKQIHIQSYQCSPLSTPEGIVSTFRQCAKLQKDKDLNKFVSVVVLDEIGLAEDSPLMPLKTLHPLLEDGTATTEESGTTSDHHRVGFIGLSNWALDPAKMNRGIMLSRGVPSEEELHDSARGICSGNEEIQRRLEETIERLCAGYFDLHEKQSESKTLKDAQKDEFFGLRDFYSLVKMVYGFASQADPGNLISDIELEQSIRRNFSGLDDLDPVKIFCREFPRLKRKVKFPSRECHPVNLIEDSLGKTEIEGESRYLLILTENYAALRLLQRQLCDHDPVIIFGSSFPKDQQYTQICRNINRIKVCMETGRMVVLLNLESLYESLYDALNQYYVYLDKQKYVDLGLGNHRVKCRVADKFKLIVVAEKDVVYQRFPIPLINRLEKHLLVMSTGLKEHQASLVKDLEEWVEHFSNAKPEHASGQSVFRPGDCFVGYHSDTAAAVVMKIFDVGNYETNQQILAQSKYTLLQTASPDAIARLAATELKHEAENLWTEYFKNQKHGSLKDYLVHCLGDDKDTDTYGSLVQITTYSRLLSQANSRVIASEAGFRAPWSRCVSLQEFHTEQQFTKTLEEFFVALGGAEGLLLVQCDNGERNFNLIACCRYLVDDIRRRTVENFGEAVKPIHIVFIIQLPKIAGGCQHFVGFQGGKWQSIHVDELLESNEQLPHIEQLVNRSVSDLFQSANLSRSDDVGDIDVDQNLDASEEPNEETPGDGDEEERSKQIIKPTLLLKNCLQAAAARIYDESAEVNRATKRIEILLEWLPDDDSQETELSKILAARIHKLLLKRDDKCPEDQRLWLQHEALCQGHLQETGTFRKALWQKLSSIVSPMLSEVIAYCDQNHNLGLLHQEKEWKTRLWLTMINDEIITPLSYDSFISPVSGRIRERARVLSSGAGPRFNGKFPFSWIIKDMVNVLLLQVGADPSKTLVSLRAVFHLSPLGNLLQPVFADEIIKNEAAMNYMNDFLHMMYKPMVEGELQLICDAVLTAAGQIHQLLDQNEEFELDIPFIHYSYSLIQARLVNFSELVHAFPDLVKKLLALRARLDVGEMILDVVALECCLQQLEPKPKDLENNDNRLIWCNRVQCIRPIIQVMKTLISKPSQQQIEDTYSEARFPGQLFGNRSAHIFQICRTAWIRLDVVRLFIEHTCPPGQSTHPADAQNAFLLWRALGENLDFSTEHTMTVIERFLKTCSDGVSKRLLKFDVSECAICKRPLQDPVQMPCQHVCCVSCANDWFKDHDVCPLCREQVGANFKVEVNQRLRRALEVYNSFRNRCKSFFMELVSLYCFGEQLPNPDLVQKFISYVIKDENRTEDFTPFDGQGIDVSPVVRSYILQQLLSIKEREKEVHGHLQEYFGRARGLAVQTDDLIEVCVLCVQCMEDVETVKLLKAKKGGENVQVLSICSILERTLRTIPETHSLDINCLKDIAGIRAALDVLSTYLRDDFDENFKNLDAFPKCLDAARHLCNNPSRNVVQLFLLKQLVRHDPNGIDAVKERCKRRELKWIMPPQAEDQDKSPDTFIVHHENYHTVREALANGMLTSKFDDLDAVIKDLQAQPAVRSCYVLLALFREITTSFSHANEEGKIPNRILKKLSQYIKGIQHLPNELKGLAGNLLTNFENGQLLRLRPGQSANDRRLIEILIHFLIVTKCLPPNQLLQHLTNLAFNPDLMSNAFIPTMPHDDAPEVMGATTGKWYECPNGHRYVITECGRPNQSYACPACRAPIGGMNHNLVANNRDASRQDRSATGHILGRAHAQSQTLTPTRNLTALATGVLRCLTHVAMLLGTEQNMQSVVAIIKPPVQDVVQFLKEHIQHDIRCIARSTGNSDDDVVQLIHLVLAEIVNNLGRRRGNINVAANLTTKDSRTIWEDAFMATYLNPVLSDMTRLLQDCLGRMVRDERLGNNRLMRLIHELDVPSHESITELSPMCPALWRYRKKITIESASFKFQEYSQARDKPDRCEVLAEFLNKEHHLRALQYLPDIIKLQRLLFEKFHRRLDRNEAEEYTLGKFLSRTQTKDQFNALVNSFKMAWKIIRSCLAQDGPYSLSQENCSVDVKNSTPISMFLPAKSGLGKCALALNNYLVTLHNDFIGRCKSLLNDESSSPEIPLTNVTKAHLVAYDPDKDFLPMIFAHCDYSLKVGEGTTIDFNWKCLERQVVDRFIRGRPRLVSLIEVFVFSKDICDGQVFKALKQKIPQVELTRPVQDQILSELNQLTDVCDVLKSLHIAIGFLSSAGGDPLMSVHEYLHSGLKMTLRNGLKSGKAEQLCQLQHIISLWMLLSLERARVLTQRKQDPFDDVSDKVKVSLDKKQKFTLNSGLQKLNVDHFVRVLLEFILLYLKNALEDQLHWPLAEYVNAKLDEKGCDEIDDLEKCIPQDIQVQHAVEAWKVACQKSEDYHSRMQP